MRIISGKFRGRKLQPSRLDRTRPTTDFAREGLFNMLASRLDFQGMEILDLYSGTGAMTFEFLSRGVDSAVAVDINTQSVKFISEIKQKWDIENLEIIKSDAIRYLDKCSYKFDLIFADPPYNSDDYDDLIRIVEEGSLLNKNAYLILEHEKRITFEDRPGFDFHRNFGNVNFSIFCFSKSSS